MVIITGATNGIGRLVALDLARQGVAPESWDATADLSVMR
jgi:NAD(P)-dependent dehydrogenase (short-subunit alcohol dehydrogenase family)